MTKKIKIKGFEGQNIEVNTGGLFFRPSLKINGKPIPEGGRINRIVLEKKDGTKVMGKWKAQLLGLDVPQLEVEGKIIPIVDPNPWYVVLWCALPITLFFRDLLWGTLFGLVAFSFNLHVFHGERKLWINILLTGAISVVWILFFILTEPAFTAPIKVG